MGRDDISDEDFETLTEMAQRGLEADHRRSFERHARKAGVPDDRLDDAWDLAKVDTSTDPDEKAMGKHVSDFLEKRPHFQGQSDAESRGAEPAGGESGKGKFVVDRKNLRDMNWMQANQSAYAKAVQDGTVKYVGNDIE